MTLTLPGADTRGFYRALGIELPGWASTNAPARCFADPDAHQREDRNPSTSINLTSGAWHCHGCGARGGAYDAALTLGHTPRSAIELMIRHGLTQPRTQLRLTGQVNARRRSDGHRARTARRPHPALHISERELADWQRALAESPTLIARLARERGWAQQTIRELGLGLDRGRITIPVRNAPGQLEGLLRYHPHPAAGQPKIRAARGSRRGLAPHPAAEASGHILLVEGEPDMIAARSRGLAAIAVPGAGIWQPEWTQQLAGRQVTILPDADPVGRHGARHIAASLQAHATVRILDLAPESHDGRDLTDWLLAHPSPSGLQPLCWP